MSVNQSQTGLASHNGKHWLWRDSWDETMGATTGEILKLLNPLNTGGSTDLLSVNRTCETGKQKGESPL